MLSDAPAEDALCKHCATIELEPMRYKDKIHYGSLSRILQTRTCAACAFIAAIWEDLSTDKDVLEKSDVAVAIEFRNKIGLRVYFGSFDEHHHFRDNGFRGIKYMPVLAFTKNDHRVCRDMEWDNSPRQLNATCDMSLMKRRLLYCLENHGEWCQTPRHNPWDLPDQSNVDTPQAAALVVDVQALRIMQPPMGCRYAALSYVWDHGTQHLTLVNSSVQTLSKEGGLKLSKLPSSVADAINVCRDLDIQYLWVDALCIVQDDPNAKMDQLYRMDEIYSLATLTLVVANDSQPSDGMGCLRSRDPMQLVCCIDGVRFFSRGSDLKATLARSRWQTRGWTYQEFLLSRRLLIFTSAQAHFVCSVQACSEDMSDNESYVPDPSRYYQAHLLDTWTMLLRSHTSTSWHIYNSLVENYSKRQLTYPSDSLNAISGCLKALGRYTGDTFICGLPAKHFPLCLLWQPTGSSQRNLSFPSWSWVGWKIGILDTAKQDFGTYYGVDALKNTIVTALKDLRFCSSRGTDLPIDQMSSDDYLEYGESLEKRREYFGGDRQQQTRTSSAEEIPAIGELRCRSKSVFLSIEPNITGGSKAFEGCQLYNYKLMKGSSWVGTIFLTPECARLYPESTQDCEFLLLSSFSFMVDSVIPHRIGLPLPDWSNDPLYLFDDEYYPSGISMYRNSGFGDLTPLPRVRMKHVMWIKRVDDAVERLAIGAIAHCQLDWREDEFCLR